MAEPLYALGEGLHWAPTSAPRGQFVAIQDRVDASGAFLVHHFLALFLKAGHRVCFLNFSHSREHYTAVGRKLGVNLTSSVEKQTLRIIDGFDQVDRVPSTAAELFQQLRHEVATAIVPVSIIIDDLSSIKWHWGRAQLVQFLRCCRALTAESQGQANIIVLGHSDVDPTGTASDSSQSLDSLAPVIAEISTVVLAVAPLPSGYFKDVHGTISVQRQCLGLDGVYDKSVTSFKVLENTVKCFASGGDALRSIQLTPPSNTTASIMDEHSYDSWGSDSDRFQDGSLCIGIDLGTTNSCVGMWHVERNHVKILKNHTDRGRTTPSVVHYKSNSEEVVVGNAAIALEYEPVGNTVRTIKRLMGQRFDSKAVELTKQFATHTIVATKQGNAAVQIQRGGTQVLQPEEISAAILRDLKTSAEAYWESKDKQRIDNVVITVPAYFNDSQRKATILSAQMAGFKAIRLLNEPTAAAMAYGLFLSGEKHVVVFDFGGGTLDVSLLSICDGKFEVLGIGGDTNLGGEDINDLVVAYVLDIIQKKHNVSRSALSRGDLIQIKRQAELAKIALSSEETTEIELVGISALKERKKPFKLTLTREKFETICASIWDRCLQIVEDVLTEAGVRVSEIDEVIMVGGSTRVPIMRSKVSAFFEDKELCLSVNADEVVCEGAAIQAAILSGLDKRVFRDVLMMDVIPLPVGLQKADGKMEVLLPKNSRIPVTMTKYFETYEDGQRGLTVQVYEGESEIAEENDHISDFNFPIPRDKIGKAGEFSHPVTLTMNASGVLQVQAGIHHDSEEAPMSTTSLFIMVGYIVVLFALWVYLRIMFADERIETAT